MCHMVAVYGIIRKPTCRADCSKTFTRLSDWQMQCSKSSICWGACISILLYQAPRTSWLCWWMSFFQNQGPGLQTPSVKLTEYITHQSSLTYTVSKIRQLDNIHHKTIWRFVKWRFHYIACTKVANPKINLVVVSHSVQCCNLNINWFDKNTLIFQIGLFD